MSNSALGTFGENGGLSPYWVLLLYRGFGEGMWIEQPEQCRVGFDRLVLLHLGGWRVN